MIKDTEYSIGRNCPTKILHLRAGLPRGDQTGPFADWMSAESGKIRALARHFFPDAAEPTPGENANRTQLLLAAGITVAGAQFDTGTAVCRVDFAARQGATIRLYQVVAKTVDLPKYNQGLEFTGPHGHPRVEWRHHLELAAFRQHIVQQLWPQHRVIPFFIAPLAGAVATVEGLPGMFEETPAGWRTTDPAAAREAPNLIRQFSIAKECAPLLPSIPARVAVLEQSLRNPPPPRLCYACKKCEFKVPDSGYSRCWKSLADVSPHMFDLAWVYFVQEGEKGDKRGTPVVDRLAREGRASMYDIPVDLIRGEYSDRQLMQLESTASGEEIIHPELAAELDKLVYPLSFLDIEALRTVVPLNRGAKSGGLSVFQLSVHRQAAPGAELTHIEWLNTAKADPNRRFLTALRAALGDVGSVLVWTKFEEDSFRELRDELLRSDDYDDDVRWLDQLLIGNRLVDQNKLCLDHYMHPKMQGRTSIKAVLPAVWSVDSPVKAQTPFNEFPADTDPYAYLKNLGLVADGVAAMATYVAMQSKEGADRENAAHQLLKYCGVDTAAMAIILFYWQWRLRSLPPTVSLEMVPAAERDRHHSSESTAPGVVAGLLGGGA